MLADAWSCAADVPVAQKPFASLAGDARGLQPKNERSIHGAATRTTRFQQQQAMRQAVQRTEGRQPARPGAGDLPLQITSISFALVTSALLRSRSRCATEPFARCGIKDLSRRPIRMPRAQPVRAAPALPRRASSPLGVAARSCSAHHAAVDCSSRLNPAADGSRAASRSVFFILGIMPWDVMFVMRRSRRVLLPFTGIHARTSLTAGSRSRNTSTRATRSIGQGVS
jgi:hypothetical protein